ncbi:MAG: ribosomal protein S18-alanine N-acetyltransferase [Halobacteriota archaeon]|nr:ribosomal protein S18-alanine N-acetyltransferase [Halobacteriota archaeon]
MVLIRVRIFEPADFAQLMSIEREAFNESNPLIYTQIYETCSNGFLVAEVEGVVVGYIVGILVSEMEGKIFSFAVSQSYQCMGIGTQLLKSIFEVFKANEVYRVNLEVRMSNKNARSLYSKLGFDVIGRIPMYYSDGEDAIIMKRVLTKL